MADDLTLQILLKTLLDAKGFEEAQTALRQFKDAANNTQAPVKGLTKELGGSRGAVADMTRVLLMNIGATQQSGEVAKFAGAAMYGLGAAASGVTVGAAALVALMSFLVPKIIAWFEGTKNVKEQTDLLTGSVSSELDFLEDYSAKIGTLNTNLQTRLDKLREVAFEEQKLKVQSNAAEIEKLAGLTTKLNEANARRFRVTENYVEEDKEASKQAQELTVQVEAAAKKIEALRAENVELNQAIKDGVVLERLRKDELKFANDEEARAKKLLEERRREEERARQVRLDTITETGKRQQAIVKERAEARKKHQEDLEFAAKRLLELEAEKRSYQETTKAAIQARKEQTANDAQQLAASTSYYLSFFGNTKATRIAQAIADTYAAATRALAELGPIAGPIMAAVMVAQGLRNVAEIERTNVGFDDPFNDMLAEKLGRKSAQDFVRYFGIGFQGGMTSGGTINNYQSSTTINRGVTLTGGLHSHAIVGSKATNDLKYLNRALIDIGRLEGRTRIGA